MSSEKNPSTQTSTVPESTSTRPVIAPVVDIYENQNEYLVLADLPGVAGEHVQIRYENGELSLYARRQEATEQGNRIGSEIFAADYRRRFHIPETVDSEKIDAKLQNGVLHLVLPKASKARPRQIAVKAH